MEKWENKVAVVTGASSGIGAAVAKKLLQHGMKVIGIARRSDRIEEMKKCATGRGELHAYKADISIEEEIVRAFDWIKENFGAPHVLVNNAGIARGGMIENLDLKHIRDVFMVNVIGLISCTQKTLTLMRGAGITYGHIINMNSVLGHNLNYLTDDTAAYGPSKFAVTAFTEVLRKDLRNSKSHIKVSSISPGHVETEIIEASRRAVGLGSSSIKQIPALQPADIADTVVYILSTPPHVQIHEIIIKPQGEIF